MENILLKGQDLTVLKQGRVLLDHVDIEISRGEIVTLVGPNGAGKSTLLRALIGLEKISSGTIYRTANLRFGYVPQRLFIGRLLPMTVERFLSTTGIKSREKISNALEEMGVASLQTTQLVNLSGGERQRVMMARAVLRCPDFLVLDEPTQGVDLSGELDLYALIAKARQSYHCSVLMVSHNLHLVMRETDRVICLNHHVCCTGHPETVGTHPEYLKLFGHAAAQQLAIYTHRHDHIHVANGATMPISDCDCGKKSDDSV